MKIVHSSFDSLYFSIQGALSSEAIQRFSMIKEQSVRTDEEVAFKLPQVSTSYRLKNTGKRGGYSFVISTGHVGVTIAFKTSLARDQHNAFVEVSSACLLAHGWKEAVIQSLDHVKALGFHVVQISLNRADYCVDFLNAPIRIDPRDFVAHSRVKKTCFHESGSVGDHVMMRDNHVDVRTVSQSDTVKSITLGKMPGRQIIVYDKRAEVIERRKFYWFEAWGVDLNDPVCSVHRIEVRAGKAHLLNNHIRTLEEFEARIGHVLNDAVRAIRWVQYTPTDANVTRAPLHPVWQALQTHLQDAMSTCTSPLSEKAITQYMREAKVNEYKSQIIGLFGGMLGCQGVVTVELGQALKGFIDELAHEVLCDDRHPIWRSYSRAKDVWTS